MKSRSSLFIWRSFGDLMAGLMLVFLVIMIAYVAKTYQLEEENDSLTAVIKKAIPEADVQTMLSEHQSEILQTKKNARKIVGDIGQVVSTRLGIAKNVSKLLPNRNGVNVDPITADMTISEGKLAFGFSKTELLPANRKTLKGLAPKYICALWAYEYTSCLQNGGDAKSCSTLDVKEPLRVQGIHVRGSADLKQVEPNGSMNTSVKRARLAQNAVMDIMRECAGGAPCFGPTTEGKLCQKKRQAVWHYTQQRLQTKGDGYTKHCTSIQSAQSDGDCEDINEKAKAFRNVSFSFELSNSDPTSIMVNLERLESQLTEMKDASNSSVILNGIARVSEQCWSKKRHQEYLACGDIAEVCRELNPAKQEGKLKKGQNQRWNNYSCAEYFKFCEGNTQLKVCSF